MLTFILATWSLVGIISGLILSKLDCTTVRVKEVFKSNPTIIDFRK